MLATTAEAHAEWHLNAGVPMGQPGCPWDACHLPDPTCWTCDDTGTADNRPCPDCGPNHEHECRDCGAPIPCWESDETCRWEGGNAGCTCAPVADPWTGAVL